jgi:hypothetical protein
MQSIHELCWSVLLPASLLLWLVASTIEEENRDSFPGDDVMDEVFAVIPLQKHIWIVSI